MTERIDRIGAEVRIKLAPGEGTVVMGLMPVGKLEAAAGLARRATRWGATADELTMHLPGDACLIDGPEARTMMTRAISISAPPEVVWPWLAQLGRVRVGTATTAYRRKGFGSTYRVVDSGPRCW